MHMRTKLTIPTSTVATFIHLVTLPCPTTLLTSVFRADTSLVRLDTEFCKHSKAAITDAGSTAVPALDGFHMKKAHFLLPCAWQGKAMKIRTNPISRFETGNQHEIQSTHPVPIPAGVERHVWVV